MVTAMSDMHNDNTATLFVIVLILVICKYSVISVIIYELLNYLNISVSIK